MANLKEYPRNKENSKIGKVIVDRDLCIGAATCIATSPGTYELDGENKAIVIDPDSVDDETLIASAQACPTKAVLLYDKEGNKIFPED